MEIQLVKGQFNTQEALDIITKFIHVKIKFHESKISQSLSEEDIKMRESKIKHLQQELYKARKHIEGNGNTITFKGEMLIS